MPEKDYSKGKIYRIWCISGECDDVYVGSTIQPLHQLWAGHKTMSKSEKGQRRRIYQAIAGNWDAWKIELIELYPCISRMELERREGELIRETGTLNTNIAGRTIKEYREQNADKIKQKQKQYNEKNADKIKQYREQYLEQNKDKIKQQKKQNYEKNQYYEKNAEKIKERQHKYFKNMLNDPIRHNKHKERKRVEIADKRAQRKADIEAGKIDIEAEKALKKTRKEALKAQNKVEYERRYKLYTTKKKAEAQALAQSI